MGNEAWKALSEEEQENWKERARSINLAARNGESSVRLVL